MACKTESKVIQEKTIEVTQYPGREGFKIKIKLMKLILPSVGSFFSSGGIDDISGVLDGNFSDDMISGIVKQLGSTLDEDSTLDFVLRILKMTRIDDYELTTTRFDTEFPGKFKFLYEILGFVLKVNYSDFFDGIDFGGILKKVQKKETPETTEATDSNPE